MPLISVKVSNTKPILMTLNNKLSISIRGGKLGSLISVGLLCKVRSAMVMSSACNAAKVNKLYANNAILMCAINRGCAACGR